MSPVRMIQTPYSSNPSPVTTDLPTQQIGSSKGTLSARIYALAPRDLHVYYLADRPKVAADHAPRYAKQALKSHMTRVPKPVVPASFCPFLKVWNTAPLAFVPFP